MPAASSDGRDGRGQLSTGVIEAGVTVDEAEPRRERWRLIDIAFFVFFIGFVIGTLGVVVMGIGSILAGNSPALHETFHVRALGGGVIGERIYQRMADASHGMPSSLLAWLSVGFSIFNIGLAIFLVWLRPRDRTARLLSIGMVGTAAIFNFPAQTTIEILTLTPIESSMHSFGHILTGLSYSAALMLFPDGRPIPRWRAPMLIVLYAPLVALTVWLSLSTRGTGRPNAILVFFGVVVPIVGVLAQAYRFRTSDDPGRHQQARLLFWALLPALGIGVWFLVTNGLGAGDAAQVDRGIAANLPDELFQVFLPVFLLVPIALFLGLIRYRLWDIDRVVNRTLVYGLVTGILLSAYLGVVVLLQRLLQPLTARNDVAVAISTLLAAAAFSPLRRRIQDFVDRRFYRHRYNAQQTVETFSSRLRDQLDLEALAFELRGVVSRTMQPTDLTLLLRDPDGQMRWQWTYRGGS